MLCLLLLQRSSQNLSQSLVRVHENKNGKGFLMGVINLLGIGLASKKQPRKRVTHHRSLRSWLEVSCGASWHQWWGLCFPWCSQQTVVGDAPPLVLQEYTPSVSESLVTGPSAAEKQLLDILRDFDEGPHGVRLKQVSRWGSAV
jgi:hypothetical protein